MVVTSSKKKAGTTSVGCKTSDFWDDEYCHCGERCSICGKKKKKDLYYRPIPRWGDRT